MDHWGKLSDDALLAISFTTEDPENLESLVEEVPPAEAQPFVEFAYDFRGSKRAKIRCAHCKYPNHLAGFVIKVDDGRRFLCGQDCGAKIYGANFDSLHKDFSHAKDRASQLRRLNRLRAALPAFLANLRELRDCASFVAYALIRTQIAKRMPRLFGALRTATVRAGGALNVEQKTRDFDAEGRDEERYEREMEDWKALTVTARKREYQPSEPRSPLFKTILKPIGTIPSTSLFSDDSFPEQIVRDVALRFDVIASECQADMSTKEIAKLLKAVGALLDHLERQIERLSEIPAFFQPNLLSLVAGWATQTHLAGIYKPGLNKLTFEPDHADEVQISVPKDYHAPSPSGIRAFRDAINFQ